MAPDFLYEPPVAERTVGFSPGRAANPLEHSTLDALLQGGLPVNASHLKKIHKNLQDGIYDKDREKLVQDVKSDPALFLFCARESRLRKSCICKTG